MASPEAVADHRDRMASRHASFFGKKRSPERRTDAENVEIVCRDEQGEEAAHRIPFVKARVPLLKGDQAVERARLVAQVRVVRPARVDPRAVRRPRLDRDDLVRPRDARQRREEQRANPAVKGGVGPQAQSEGDHGDQRKARALRQRPERVPQIVKHRFSVSNNIYIVTCRFPASRRRCGRPPFPLPRSSRREAGRSAVRSARSLRSA